MKYNVGPLTIVQNSLQNIEESLGVIQNYCDSLIILYYNTVLVVFGWDSVHETEGFFAGKIQDYELKIS